MAYNHKNLDNLANMGGIMSGLNISSLKLKNYVMASFFLVTLIALANASEAINLNASIDSYAGFEAVARKMQFKKGFGDHIFDDKYYNQINMFAGFKISERVAIEFEREISIKKLESRSKDGETDFFGEKLKHIASGFDDIKNHIYSTSRISGYSISLVGLFPVWKEKNISFISSIGMGYLKSNIKCTLTQIGESKIVLTNPSEIIPLQIVAVTKSIYARRMPTVRLSAGFQHIVNNNLGFRIIAAWENTHKIKIQGKDAITMRLVNEYAKLKDSIIYKIGFFVPF